MSQPTLTTGRQKKVRDPTSGTPPPTANTTKLRQRATPETTARAIRAEKYTAARKFLEANCILATDAPCTPSTLTNSLLILATSFKMPQMVVNALTHLSEVSTKIETHCEGCTKAEAIPKLLEELCVDMQLGVEGKLEEIGQSIVEKTTDQGNLDKATDKLEEAAKGLIKAAEALEAKVSQVSVTTTKIANTANTYRDALLKAPPRRAAQGDAPQIDEAIARSTDRKLRQVLIELPPDEMRWSSLESIKAKAMEAIKKIVMPAPPEDIEVTEITKTRRNGLILLLNTKEAASWLQETEVELLFTGNFSSGAIFKPRQYTILVPRIPLTFSPEQDAHLREVEEGNDMEKGTIAKARWIKPAYRRKPEQRVAHATLMIRDAKIANKCIKDGLYICGTKVFPEKLKQEPTQCMKCRKWGHYAADCSAEKDTCGTCGGEHRSSECTDHTKRYCVSCKANDHASWDRNCPEFAKKCEWFNGKYPENKLRYFPTEDEWTHIQRPPRIPLPERFPAHFAVGSLPPPNRNGRELPTRTINPRPKRSRNRKRNGANAGQHTLDQYFTPSQREVSSQNREEESEEEDQDEQDEFVSANPHPPPSINSSQDPYEGWRD